LNQYHNFAMHRSTIVLALISLGLLSTLVFVGWQLFSHEGASLFNGEGDSLALGLTDDRQNEERKFTAHSAVLWDSDAQVILLEQNGFQRMPIASITKLMTAMVALDYGFSWEEEVNILPKEYVQGGKLVLHAGETLTMKDLLNASLLGSANNATLALVRQLGVDEEKFIQEMNIKAIELGLEQTKFVDVTGLDPENVSTAYEVALLAQVAFEDYPVISDITSQKEYAFTLINSDREHLIKNTNKLITAWGVGGTGSKTGYLYEARYCLVMRGVGDAENRIAVILNSPSEVEHFADTKKLLQLRI